MEKNKTRYVVYCITNKCNGMKYIGKTHYGIKVRWNRHKNEAYKDKPNCRYLCRAIVKYGPENFDIVEIDHAEDKLKLIDLESKYIIEYNTLAPNGYNLKLKTENSVIYSEETITRFRNNFYQNHFEYTQTKEYSDLQRKIKQGKKLPTRAKVSSKYVGVFWDNDKNRWYSKLNDSRNVIRLGYYDDEKTAAIAYDHAVLKHFGETGTFNFPEMISIYKESDPPLRRSKPIHGRFPGVIKRTKNKWVGWLAIVKIGDKRKTKIFSNKKYVDAEESAHLWRLYTIKEFNLQDET